MSTGALLRMRVRHEPGALARIASILNPFPVTELHYVVDDSVLAGVIVRVEANPSVVARVLLRLERLVPVLDVIAQPDPSAAALASSAREPAAEAAEGALAFICV